MASFPSSIKTFPTLVDLADSVLAAHQNERGDEITAIETELGTDPKGSDASVKARLDRLEGKAFSNGSAVLGSAFSISGAAGIYQDTGLSIILPGAGDWLVRCGVRVQLQGNTGTEWFLQGKFYNSTLAADVVNSERMLIRVKTTNYIEATIEVSMIVTVAASSTIKLYAARNGGGTPSWTVSQIASDGNGRTLMQYNKIDD
ncbi:hypothetical protein FBQ81_03175 [Chloroflexi bacterium CFX6]|nr:hypothetical protein [Chloroflexi bacterium CFX6]